MAGNAIALRNANVCEKSITTQAPVGVLDLQLGENLVKIEGQTAEIQVAEESGFQKK